MTRVVIAGTDTVLEAGEGDSLLATLQSAKHPVSTSCGGVATCALCRITVKRGKENLSPINEKEITHLGNIAKIIGLRLACQARVSGQGEVEIDVPPVEDIAAKKQAKAERLRQQRALNNPRR
jgi:ferredoxin